MLPLYTVEDNKKKLSLFLTKETCHFFQPLVWPTVNKLKKQQQRLILELKVSYLLSLLMSYNQLVCKNIELFQV